MFLVKGIVWSVSGGKIIFLDRYSAVYIIFARGKMLGTREETGGSDLVDIGRYFSILDSPLGVA